MKKKQFLPLFSVALATVFSPSAFAAPITYDFRYDFVDGRYVTGSFEAEFTGKYYLENWDNARWIYHLSDGTALMKGYAPTWTFTEEYEYYFGKTLIPANGSLHGARIGFSDDMNHWQNEFWLENGTIYTSSKDDYYGPLFTSTETAAGSRWWMSTTHRVPEVGFTAPLLVGGLVGIGLLARRGRRISQKTRPGMPEPLLGPPW